MTDGRRIVKKVLPESFELIESGKKNFEFRLADFEVREGDTLVLEEWDSMDKDTRQPTGRVIEKKVNLVKKYDLEEFNSKEDLEKHGIYVLGLE